MTHDDLLGTTCLVTVKGAGLSAEKNVDVSTAMTVMQVIFGATPLPPRGLDSGPIAQGTRGASSQRLSIREYVEEVAGKTIPAKIAAIARYIRDHEQQSDFSREDIKSRFRSAGEIMPANFPRDFQKALQAGWIAEDPQSKGRFYVTRRGDEAMQQRFEGASPISTRTRRRRRPAAGEAPESGDGQ
jgi:hypothetical protein